VSSPSIVLERVWAVGCFLESKLTFSDLQTRRSPTEEATASYHRREREAGAFSRTLSLPMEIAVEKVSARYSEGILTIVVPKAEMAKPKQIKIQLS